MFFLFVIILDISYWFDKCYEIIRLLEFKFRELYDYNGLVEIGMGERSIGIVIF